MSASSIFTAGRQFVTAASRSIPRAAPALGGGSKQIRFVASKRSDAAETAQDAAQREYQKEHVKNSVGERVETVTDSAAKMAWETIPRVGTEEFEHAEEIAGLKPGEDAPKKQQQATE